jgi:hypothetical protein
VHLCFRTTEVWYYEQPLPEGRKNYTKTAPIQFEEFAPLIAWWSKREENERAWKVPAVELFANNCNLDRKNPRAKKDITHLPPAQLAADIMEKEHRIAEIMGNSLHFSNSSIASPIAQELSSSTVTSIFTASVIWLKLSGEVINRQSKSWVASSTK